MSTDLETNLQIIEEFTQRLQVAVIGAEQTTDKHVNWVEGPIDGVIETANGPLKTLRGQIAEWRLSADQDVASTIDGYDVQFAAALAQFNIEFEEYLTTIGFESAVEYASDILIERRAQTVVYNGVTYYWTATLPYTTTGNFGTEMSWQIAPIVGGIETPSFTFAGGGKLLRKTQSVLGLDGEWYYWTGAFPKTIAAASTLESAGGVGENLFKISSGFPPLRPTLKLLSTSIGMELNVGSFEGGATLTAQDEVLAQFLTGKLYKWNGAFPKVVDLHSTPSSSGGISPTGWSEIEKSSNWTVSLEALRRSYAEAGYNVVGTFRAGFTYVNANDVGIDLATGKGYTGPAGTVAAGTNSSDPGFKDVSYKTSLLLNIENYGAKADFDPNNPTVINTNSSQALYLACQDALKLGGGVPWVPAREKYFYIDDTTAISNLWELSQPDSTVAPRIIGESILGSKIAFDAKGDPNKKFLFGRYPSGWPTSAAIEDLTLLAVNGGQGVVTEGACFAYAHRVYFQGFDVAYYPSNGSPGRFSELSRLSMCWFRYNKTALKLRKDSGNDSYNGFNLDHNLIEVDPGCLGIDIGPGCFVYNSTWQGSFAGSGTYILNNGTRVLSTDDFHFEGTGSVDNRGEYSVDGFWHHFDAAGAPINDISTKPITVGASYTTPLNYTAAPLVGFPCKPKGSVFTSATRAQGGIFPVRAAGVDSAMYVGYRGFSDWDNGLFVGSVADGDYSLEKAQVHYCMSLNGIKAFDSTGFGLVHVNYPDVKQFDVTARGRGDAKLGHKQTIRVTASPSPQTIVATSFAAVGSDKTRMLSIRIKSVSGDLIDIRRVYLTVDAAYGSEFTAVHVGNVMALDDGSPSVVFDNASVISKPTGISMTLTTSQDVDVDFSLVGIGDT